MILKNTNNSRYRPEIDGLRAFAIIAVIIYHFNKNLLPSGYLGVDIFFVISGYVITSSLAQRKSKNFLDFLLGFYERRIKRIIPALALYVIITSILIHLFIQNAGSYYLTGVLSLFGISNLYTLSNIGSYWGFNASMNPFTNTWSLGVEEQFYILFPFLFWFSGIGKDFNNKKNFLIWVSLLTMASLLSFIYMNQTNPSASYYLMPNRFWEISMGCLTYIFHEKKIKVYEKIEKIPPFIVIAAIFSLMFLPIAITIPSTISAVFLTTILLVCLKKGSLTFDILTNSQIVYIGLLSYSLYLWHSSIIALARWSIGISKTTIVPLIFLISIFSITSYEIVEKNIRNKSWSSNRVSTIIKGFFTVIAASMFSVFLGTGIRAKYYLGENKSANPPTNILPNSVFHLFGDSHAQDIQNLLRNNGTFRTKLYMVPGCRFYLNLSSECKKFNRYKSILLQTVKSGDVIIFASNYLPYISKEVESKFDESLAITQFLDEMVPPILDKNARIVIKLPHPKVNPPKVPIGLICKKEFFRPIIDPKCFVEGISKSKFLKKNQTVMKPILEQITESHPSVLFWSIVDSTCPDKICFPVTEENQYFRDHSHLFISSAKLSDAIVEKLNELFKNHIEFTKIDK